MDHIKEMIDLMQSTAEEDIKRLTPAQRLKHLLDCYDFLYPRMQRINYRTDQDSLEDLIDINIVNKNRSNGSN